MLPRFISIKIKGVAAALVAAKGLAETDAGLKPASPAPTKNKTAGTVARSGSLG
jgi:hypothetical protein